MWFSKLLRFAREGSLAVALTVGMVSAPIAYAAPAPAVTADAPAEGGDQPFWKKVDWQKWGNVITRATDIASRVMGYMGQNMDPRTSTGKMAIGSMLTGLAPMIGYLVPPPAGVIAGAVMGVVGLGLTFWGRHQMKKEAEDALKNLPGGGVGPVAVPGIPTDVGSERPTPGIPGGGGSGIPGGGGSGSGSTGNGASSPTDVATGPNGTPSDTGVGTPGSTGNGASGGSQPTVPGRRGIDDYIRDLPGLPGSGAGSTGNGASTGNGGVATPGTGIPAGNPRTPVSGNGPTGDEGTNVGRNAGTTPNGSGTVAGPGRGRRTIDDYRGDIGGRGGVAGSGASNGGSSTGVGVDRESRGPGGIDVGRDGRTAGNTGNDGIPGSGRISLPGRGDRSGSAGTGGGPSLSDVLAGRYPNRDRAVTAGNGSTASGNNVGRNADTRGTAHNGGVRRGSGVGIGQWR